MPKRLAERPPTAAAAIKQLGADGKPLKKRDYSKGPKRCPCHRAKCFNCNKCSQCACTCKKGAVVNSPANKKQKMSPAVKAGRGGGRGRGRPRGASVSAAASSSLATGSISPTSPTSPSLGRGRAGRGGSRGKRGGSIGSMTGRGSSVSTRGSRGGRGGGSRGGGSSRGGGGAGTWGVRGRARGRPAGVGSGGGRGPGRPPGSATSKAAALAKAAAGGGLFSGGQGGPAGVGGGMGSHVLDSSNGSMHSGSSHHSLGSSHSTVRSLGSSAGFGSSVRGRGRGRGGGFGGNAGWSLARVSAREPSPELIPESPPIVSPYAAAIHAKPLDIEPQKCSVCNETMDLLDSKADCASCDYLAHAKCLDLDKALEKVVSSRKDWRCADCKFCHECGTVGNAANILLCDICDNGLHLKCAYPKLSKVPRGEVRCNDCQPAKTLTGKKGAIPVIGAGRNFGRYKFTHDEKQLLTSGANEMELLEVDTSEEKPQQELEFGQHLLKCWYPAPVLACDPEEQSHLPTIHVCEYCLEMHKTPAQIARHRSTCTWRHPPGTEIYRNEDLSFFQVDGRHWKSYCQNLCVLSKCFLKTKTLFYDVQTFLFYVLVQWDKNGGQLVGYFSKEKQPDNNYNLSCLLTFPHKQRQGYGKLLIEFSYLLTRREGKTGSPERPLSDLGLLSYRSYWLDTVAENVVSMAADGDKHVTIKALSDKTGIEMYDIISTLQDTRLIKYTACEHWILTDHPLLEKHKETSAKGARTRIDDKLLVWKPYVPTREDMAIRHQSAGNRARRRHR